MKTRPETLTWMTAALAAVGASVPLQIMILHGHPPNEFFLAFHKLTTLNGAVMLSCGLSAFLAWRASPFMKYILPLTVLLVGWNNWAVEQSPLNDFAPGTATAASLVFLGLQALCFHPEAKKVLKDPSLRWWLTPRRKAVRVPVFIQTWMGETIKAHTHDLSSEGLFIPLGIRELNNHPKSLLKILEAGKRVDLNLVLSPLNTIHCEAEVVRFSQKDQGGYPPGIGLRIIRHHGQSKEEISKLLAA
jgi:hypothetical protein